MKKLRPTRLKRIHAPHGLDPLQTVQYTGNAEVDSKAELSALQQGFRDREKADRLKARFENDSEFWFAIAFASRSQKEEFLRLANLADLGDKYLDGRKVAKVLGILLKGEDK